VHDAEDENFLSGEIVENDVREPLQGMITNAEIDRRASFRGLNEFRHCVSNMREKVRPEASLSVVVPRGGLNRV